MTKFFVSYNNTDKAWAEWIAWIMEENDHPTIIRAWDFRPGGNFVLDMQRAVEESDKTLIVLSDNYLNAELSQPEWANTFTEDLNGLKRKIIPIRVQECTPKGLLRLINSVDLFGLDEKTAQEALLNALPNRIKPKSKPVFPKSVKSSNSNGCFSVNRPPFPSTPHSKFTIAPLPPKLLIGRDNDLEFLLSKINQSNDVQNIHKIIAIQGWPGVGKSTLTSALVHHSLTGQHFQDGVLWETLGPIPKRHKILTKWSQGFGICQNPEDKSEQELSGMLRSYLSDRQMLLVLDDVWNPHEVTPLIIGGPRCITVITTRLPMIARELASSASDIYELKVLSEEAAFLLLRKISPSVTVKYPREAKDLLIDLERLPLAIKVAASLLETQSKIDDSYDLLILIEELSKYRRLLEQKPPADRPDSVEVSTTVASLFLTSIERLPPDLKRRFMQLSALAPKPAVFESEKASVAWAIRGRVVKEKLLQLLNRGLVETIGNDTYWIHASLMATAKWIAETKF